MYIRVPSIFLYIEMEQHYTKPQHQAIKHIVREFWQADRENAVPLRETIIPKGIIEIIFNFETPPLYVSISGQQLTIPRCFLQGFHTSSLALHLSGRQTFFGVVLYPAAVEHLFHYIPLEFVNSITDLCLVDSSFNTLWHQLAELITFDDRVSLFTQWLMHRLPDLTERELAINDFLYAYSNTAMAVQETARNFCYSPKQLARKLYALTGMNTEQTLLYRKYVKAVHLIHFSPLSLTEITYACNFSDQPHFSKTFRGYTSFNPKAYREIKSNIPGHILQNVL